ncbi:hypothetical protein LPB140_03250 [Sphingorhabdus lutea]|uniref:Uncharacterized protein n=1 Tax=Sphingorhabdus lutea TaxID=1913578 RepID=A0A1L3JA53_9SPHN|nr:hypothetical protein [Sphingorhabdus lutea]APG61998.1 hypothetical protein LPB140_03250 [Sphingorhabdus lutea]
MDKKPEVPFQAALPAIVVTIAAVIQTVVALTTLNQTNLIIAIGCSVVSIFLWKKHFDKSKAEK